MVISEGWDIPRACMLYQVRDTQSKQLDEQVMGRVRRNPRLLDFEKLDEEARDLAMKAWIWGIKPDSPKETYLTLLKKFKIDNKKFIEQNKNLNNTKETYLKLLDKFKIDNEKFIEQNLNNNKKNIFLYFMKEYLQTNKEICKNYIIWHLIKSKKFDVFDMLDKYKDYFKCHKKVTDGYCRSVAEVPISLIKKIVTTIQNLKNFQLK